MPARFLDTNVLLRYFTRDDEEKARRALALLTRVERGEESVATSPLVVFEAVFTLQKRYGASREQVRELVWPILSLRGLQLPNKSLYRRALDLYVEKSLPFADAFNAAYAEKLGIDSIYSWDKDFDRLEGIERVEP